MAGEDGLMKQVEELKRKLLNILLILLILERSTVPFSKVRMIDPLLGGPT